MDSVRGPKDQKNILNPLIVIHTFGASALEVVDSVHAFSAIDARLRLAVIDVLSAELPLESGLAIAVSLVYLTPKRKDMDSARVCFECVFACVCFFSLSLSLSSSTSS